MFNKFNVNVPFKSDCSVSYRLGIIDKINEFPNLLHLYIVDGKISLYKDSTQLISIFNDVIKQEKLNSQTLFFNEKLNCLLNKHKYIFGLFDTYMLENNEFYKKVHNYNSFLIWGYDCDSYSTFCNLGTSGSKNIQLKYDDLKKIYCSDISKTRNAEESDILGFPLSTFDIQKVYKKGDIFNKLYQFYNNNVPNENLNIIDYIIDNRLAFFYENVYPGIEYRNILSLKTLRDMFVYHNILVSSKSSKITENNNAIIKIMDVIISLYAKYIYSNNRKYLESILSYFEKIKHMVKTNKNFIQYF